MDKEREFLEGLRREDKFPPVEEAPPMGKASTPKRDQPTDIPIEFYDTYMAEEKRIVEEWEEALDVARDELKQKLAEEHDRGA